ncbi:MAG TPA: two-component regulator propeller domain-containing protein [Candidatus Acidoferrum sp.]|nr:two-component regulator propeller domain-containing protein [Candidatus Acidoferrum sp.]
MRSETAVARHFLIDGWRTESGLPQNTVTGIAQTPDGYLWVSTFDGVARFDGMHFRTFNAGNTPALGSGRIRFLFQGRDGVLWLAPQEGGLVRLENGNFSPVVMSAPGAVRMACSQVAEEAFGALWLSDEDGVVSRLTDGHVSQESAKWTVPAGSKLQVTTDAEGALWVVGNSGLYRIEQGRLVPVLQGRRDEYIVHCPSRRGGWWLSSGGQLCLWRNGQWLLRVPAPPALPRLLRASLEDRSGHFWLGTQGNGLFRYDTNGAVLHLTRKEGLSSDWVRTVLEDREGNLWVGYGVVASFAFAETEGGGLGRLRLPLFGVYPSAQAPPSGEPPTEAPTPAPRPAAGQSPPWWERITSVSEAPDGELWVGTYGRGLKRLPPEADQGALDDPATASFHILTALADHRGDVWLGTTAGGVFQRREGDLIRLSAFPTNGPRVLSIYEDSHGAIWFGRHETGALVQIQDGATNFVPLPKNLGLVSVRTMTEDPAGNLWIGTSGAGLLCWKDGHFTRFTHTNGLSSDLIWSLLAEPDGALWVGTAGGGLTRLKAGRTAICTTRDGLPDNVICSIADDGHGQYWFSSHQGIFRVSKRELNRFADGAAERVQCIAYGRSDGLPVLEFKGGYQPASCRTRDGRLWFPTSQGLVFVDPADVSTNSVPPTIHIEEVVVDGKPIPAVRWQAESPPESSGGKKPGASGRLEIPSGRHRIEIRYTGLNFSAPEKMRFRHRLEGVDAGWVDTESQRVASYDRLPHGSYAFQVQACNREGAWSPQSASLTFVLLPFLWQTWWFECLFLLVFGGAIGWGVGQVLRRRHRRHLRLVERLHRLERERVRVARDIHDDLGSSLTAMGYWGAWAARDSKTLPEAQEQLLSIADRTRELGRKLDETVWAVSPKNDSSTRLATYLCRFVEEFLEPRNIRWRLDVAADLPEVELTTETRHNVLLVVKEAVNNTAKHARAAEVTLRVAAEKGVMSIEVSDNGLGFNPQAAGEQGNGLKNMAARMAEIGGQFEVRSAPEKGTTVCLRLPLPQPDGATSNLPAR